MHVEDELPGLARFLGALMFYGLLLCLFQVLV